MDEKKPHLLFSDSLAPVLDAACIGLWKCFADSGEVVFNTYLMQITGIDSRYSCDKNTLLQMIHPEDVAIIRDCVDACLAGTMTGFKQEHRIIRQNSSPLWVMDCCTAESDNNGRLLHLTGVLYDISGDYHRNSDDLSGSWQFMAKSGYHIMPGFAPEDIGGFACQNRRRNGGENA